MNKVEFQFKQGNRRGMVTPREATALQRAGIGRLLNRDMADQPTVQTDVFDALDRAALFALAKERGLKVGPATGAEKLRAALRST